MLVCCRKMAHKLRRARIFGCQCIIFNRWKFKSAREHTYFTCWRGLRRRINSYFLFRIFFLSLSSRFWHRSAKTFSHFIIIHRLPSCTPPRRFEKISKIVSALSAAYILMPRTVNERLNETKKKNEKNRIIIYIPSNWSDGCCELS